MDSRQSSRRLPFVRRSQRRRSRHLRHRWPRPSIWAPQGQCRDGSDVVLWWFFLVERMWVWERADLAPDAFAFGVGFESPLRRDGFHDPESPPREVSQHHTATSRRTLLGVVNLDPNGCARSQQRDESGSPTARECATRRWPPTRTPPLRRRPSGGRVFPPSSRLGRTAERWGRMRTCSRARATQALVECREDPPEVALPMNAWVVPRGSWAPVTGTACAGVLFRPDH